MVTIAPPQGDVRDTLLAAADTLLKLTAFSGFTKSRRPYAEEQRQRAEALLRGDVPSFYFEKSLRELSYLRDRRDGIRQSFPRTYTPHNLDKPGAADEFYRQALAQEARILEAHYAGYTSFPKRALALAEPLVARMREVALAETPED